MVRSTLEPGGIGVTYELDDAGNRIHVNGGACAGRYTMSNAAPEPADFQVNQYTTSGCDSRLYDKNGNLVFAQLVFPPRAKAFGYDYRNQMVNHTNAQGLALVFRYDALGRRIAKTTASGDQMTYFYDGMQVVEERDGGSNTLATYVFGLRPDDVLNMRRDGRDFYYHSDDLGNIRAISDVTGNVLERYEYGDFGEPAVFASNGTLLAQSAFGNALLFNGQRHDPESGLYYYRTRYLDPLSGRFTSRDTIGIWGDAKNMGNGYSYVANNPATFTDPSGQGINRNISCNGPSPGPQVVTIYYEGCSSSRRAANDVPVCRAFRASGQAAAAVLNLWVQDAFGVSIPGTGTTRTRVAKWFGGQNQKTSTYTKSVVGNVLGYAFEALDDNDVDIDCETGCDAGVNAYVNHGGWDVNLCSRYFTVGFTQSQQAGILVHELTHAYGDTDDYFYYSDLGMGPSTSSATLSLLPLSDGTLRENADTYMMFLENFFLP
jgi:RHS repeat-associated protein